MTIAVTTVIDTSVLINTGGNDLSKSRRGNSNSTLQGRGHLPSQSAPPLRLNSFHTERWFSWSAAERKGVSHKVPASFLNGVQTGFAASALAQCLTQ